MAAPSTPVRRTTVLPPSTPITPRPLSANITNAPNYGGTRRHSLYGTEDRIILDPGSRVWKVGFSGEGRPRDVFTVGHDSSGSGSLWNLTKRGNAEEVEESERMLEARLKKLLRRVFFDSLLTDPKSRKVIIIEHPLMPLYIKDLIAKILFNNLQVPSISFSPTHLLSLLAGGRITGLVLDSGHLESTVIPVHSSRPLYTLIRTTPLAGARLSSHLRALILLFGTYYPPLMSLGGASNLPSTSRANSVPDEILTDALIEDIKTRCCFVGEAMEDLDRSMTPTGGGTDDIEMQASESTASEISSEPDRPQSVMSDSPNVPANPRRQSQQPLKDSNPLQKLASLYMEHCTATDLSIRVNPPISHPPGTGKGVLVVPGWIRERSAEVVFEGGDVDESSVVEVILDSLLKVPVDLRKELASSILVVGGTPAMPGFIPRLQAELVRALTTLPAPTPSTSSKKFPSYDPYAPLRPLAPYIAILNNPSPPPPSISNRSSFAGKAPAFSPSSMAWVGASLAGILKTGGEEILRERWDDAEAEEGNEMDTSADSEVVVRRFVLPDWTRTPLMIGAPHAGILPPASAPPHIPAPAQVAV